MWEGPREYKVPIRTTEGNFIAIAQHLVYRPRSQVGYEAELNDFLSLWYNAPGIDKYVK